MIIGLLSIALVFMFVGFMAYRDRRSERLRKSFEKQLKNIRELPEKRWTKQ